MPKKDALVHAHYLGDTPVVMPDLAGRDRCCRDENQRAVPVDDDGNELPVEGPHPHTLLKRGDVILLDRHSAEEREDFEIDEDKKSGAFGKRSEGDEAATVKES